MSKAIARSPIAQQVLWTIYRSVQRTPARDAQVWQPAGVASPFPKGGQAGGEQGPSARAAESSLERSGSGVGAASGGRNESRLNENYTFEQFVVGPCNRLSHAAALAIGDSPGRAYNPLFIHGNVGLGKTHLLQATCHAIRQKKGDARVVYMSCEDFTNRFIHSIQNGQLNQFREYHRSVDVLVIDDIQFLANKEKTQDEFFHTFNALYNCQRQIFLSSDRPPLEIPTIEERLVSRFKWGLVAEMELPCFETRVAIVKRKARSRRVELADEVAYFIAERIDTNIRELEGAVIKIIGLSTITERPICNELAEEALRGVAVSRSNQVTFSDVMDLITGEFSLTAREITGKSRTQAISLPRQIGMYLSRELTEHSLEEVGRFFGNRDHTTVLYAVQKIKTRVKDDRMFRDLLGNLRSRLQSGSLR
ncbi:MAG: chromosomal replication initiator protein DnaA [Planctomycetota bacterium]